MRVNLREALASKRNCVAAIRLIDGTTLDFKVEVVLDDAIGGARTAAPEKQCLIPLSAILMVEFD